MLLSLFPAYPYAPVVVTFVWALLVGVVSYLLVFRLPVFAKLVEFPLALPFVSVPAMIFSFLMGFMASAAWQNIALAHSSLIAESTALDRLISIPLEPPEMKQASIARLKSYLHDVLHYEWMQYFNERQSLPAEQALDALEADAWKANAMWRADSPGSGTSAVITTAYINALDNLRVAPQQRLTLGLQGDLTVKRTLALALAFISAVTVAAANLENPDKAKMAMIPFPAVALSPPHFGSWFKDATYFARITRR
jgi:hypothetical protein